MNLRNDHLTFLRALTSFAILFLLLPLCWWANFPAYFMAGIAGACVFSAFLSCLSWLVWMRNMTVEAELEREAQRFGHFTTIDP